ncbi:MAG: hypothetical protein AAF962_17280 [Actinomycetota bacterium]
MNWAVLKRWWWLSLLVIGASACQGSFDVVIMVNEDGSGQVATTSTIDAEAAERLLDLDDEANGLVLADLAQAGWVVERPEVATDGATVITATKEFGTPAQFAEIMTELNGPEGPFRDFELVRTKSFARVDYELEGVIDTTGDLGIFADSDLERSLGQSIESIAAGYGASEQQVTLSVLATVPGEVEGVAPTRLITTTEDQVSARWQTNLDEDGTQTVAVSSSISDVTPVVLIGVAAVAGVGAFLVVFSQVLRVLLPDRRRSRKRKPPTKPKPKADDAVAAAAKTTGPIPTVNVDGGEKVPYEVLALDLMGVLYRQASSVDDVLVPFIRQRGVTAVSDEEIAARSRSLALGRITTHQFWHQVGVPGDGNVLDAEFIAQFQMAQGVYRYLRSLRDDGKRLACFTNFAAGWAAQLKVNHSLEGVIDPWVVSGRVGVRKPDTAIFEVLRRMTERPPAAIQIIDGDRATLDVARELGFGTVWFAPDGDRAEANGHPLVRNLESDELLAPLPTDQ